MNERIASTNHDYSRRVLDRIGCARAWWRRRQRRVLRVPLLAMYPPVSVHSSHLRKLLAVGSADKVRILKSIEVVLNDALHDVVTYTIIADLINKSILRFSLILSTYAKINDYSCFLLFLLSEPRTKIWPSTIDRQRHWKHNTIRHIASDSIMVLDLNGIKSLDASLFLITSPANGRVCILRSVSVCTRKTRLRKSSSTLKVHQALPALPAVGTPAQAQASESQPRLCGLAGWPASTWSSFAAANATDAVPNYKRQHTKATGRFLLHAIKCVRSWIDEINIVSGKSSWVIEVFGMVWYFKSSRESFRPKYTRTQFPK